MWKLTVVSCLTAASAFAQGLSFGVKLGHPALDAFDSRLADTGNYVPKSGRYVTGGTVELHLPMRISAELDVLYRPIRFDQVSPLFERKITASQWQFPLLIKYRLRSGFVAPFAEGGISFEHISGVPSSTPEFVDSSRKGLVLGAGLEGRLPVFRLSGEIRYTRWGSSAFRTPAGADLSNRNQLELLMGVTF